MAALPPVRQGHFTISWNAWITLLVQGDVTFANDRGQPNCSGY